MSHYGPVYRNNYRSIDTKGRWLAGWRMPHCRYTSSLACVAAWMKLRASSSSSSLLLSLFTSPSVRLFLSMIYLRYKGRLIASGGRKTGRQKGRRRAKRTRASRWRCSVLARQIVCLSGASGARTNKWKQIISWPHYANESMEKRVESGRVGREEDEGVRLPQGDGNEANECREPTVINAGLGPTRLSPSPPTTFLYTCSSSAGIEPPAPEPQPRPSVESSFLPRSISRPHRRFVSRFSIAAQRNWKLKKFDRWEVSDGWLLATRGGGSAAVGHPMLLPHDESSLSGPICSRSPPD